MQKLRVLCAVFVLLGVVVAQRWVTPPETTNFRFTRMDGEYFPGTGKVYFLGGRLGISGYPTDSTVWSYDPTARVYANTGTVLPIAVSNYDICLLRDNYDLAAGDTYGLYIFGGRMGRTTLGTDTVQVYYPRTNRARKLTTDRYPGIVGGGIPSALGAAVVGNKAYVMGGFNSANYTPSNLTLIFDPLGPSGSRWSGGPNLQFARAYVAGAVVDDTLLYAIGGDTTNATILLQARPYVERLNIRNLGAGWTRVRDLPMALGETRVFSFQNADSLLGFRRQIVVAGTGQWQYESAYCHLYTVATDSWRSFAPLDSARRNHAGAFIPGTAGTYGRPGIWIWGGRKGTDANCLATPEYYPLGLNAGCTRVIAPSGTIDSGQTATPACSVYNYGAATATFRVRMKIGALYDDSAQVTTLAPGTRLYVTFPVWRANQVGTLNITCSTRLAGDFQQSNDRAAGNVDVLTHDVGATFVVAPTGVVDSGTSLTPACSVFNYGRAAESYQVRLKIGSYDTTAAVTGHIARTRILVTFPSWTALVRGANAITCTTQLTGDMYPANDRVTAGVTVRVMDMGASAILAPAGTVTQGQNIAPQVRVSNYGTATAACDLRLVISRSGTPVYDTTETAVSVPAGDSVLRIFTKAWTAGAPGTYDILSYTVLTGDGHPENDSTRGAVTVVSGTPSGWHEETPMPTSPSGKSMKDGAWLAYNRTSKLVYAAKGNKTPDFYAWDPIGDSWHTRAPIPTGIEAKPPSKGTVGCSDSTVLFMVKGNNTQGFWKYDIALDSWRQVANVPLGLTNKKVKGGDDMVFVYKEGRRYVYLLKGYKNEFLRYDVALDSWRQMPNAPGAIVKWDKGSFLAYDGAATIYAHKAKYHEQYKFDVGGDTWYSTALKGMPFVSGSGKSKKSKDGGSGVYWDTYIYALKGGNTQEFWRYDVLRDTWAELETIPAFGSTGKKKRVKGGGDVTVIPPDESGDMPGVPVNIPAVKGNGTNEFWIYKTNGYDLYAILSACSPACVVDTIKLNTTRYPTPGFSATPTLGDEHNFGALSWPRDSIRVIFTVSATRYYFQVVTPTADFPYVLAPATNGNIKFTRRPPSLSMFPSPQVDRSGVMARIASPGPGMTLAPNPLTGEVAYLRYSLAHAGPVSVGIYDVAGRCVFVRTVVAGARGSASLDLRALSAGVYLVRVSADECMTTHKLVVQR